MQTTLAEGSAKPSADNFASLSAEAAASEVAWMRRALVAEALDGAQFQADAAMRFLERGADDLAEKCMASMFDLCRRAATAMKPLRQSSLTRASF